MFVDKMTPENMIAEKMIVDELSVDKMTAINKCQQNDYR